MKNKILLFGAILLGFISYAQAPQKMSYQAVIRNSSNVLVSNAPVGMQVSILQGSASGTPVFVETHAVSTNTNGLATLAIGTGTNVSGSIASINWSAGPFFIKTETDPTGGTSYSITGTSELMSTPYALFAANSAPGPQGIQGVPGAVGPQGVAGANGNAGPVGPQGSQGDAGTNGNDGAVGPQGIAGPVGPQGASGVNGNDGAVGPQGATGPQGVAGPVGPQGAIGPQGIAGPIGPQGATGANGNDGAVGPQGATGPQGVAGTNGNDGAVGPQGATGPQGIAGPVGPQGATGANGNDGAVGPQGLVGPAGPIAGSDKQIAFNNSGLAAGSADLTWDYNTNKLTATNAAVTALSGAGTRNVQVDNLGNLTAVAVPATGITGTGTINFHPKFTAANVLGNSLIQDNGTSLSVGATTPSVIYQMYAYRQQLTANGDGQSTLFGYRTRDSQNDGIGYSQIQANDATRGYNFWGDVYTFGVGGWNYNDYSRCGGTFGADVNGLNWGSLGYRSSGLINYGVYGSNAYASGAGFAANNLDAGIGGGFFGMVGTITKGNVIGQLNKGGLFASYNIGDVYTSGKNVELVSNGTEMTPAYAVTSTEAVIYKKGKSQMVNGSATILFDANYARLLGESPIVTITPMGQCNGVYIESVTKNGFTIKELNSGNSTVEISWIAVGDRVDANSTEVPAFVKDKSFDQKMDKVIFNDGDKTHNGEGLWWDGTTLQINKNYPREINPSREDKTRILEAEKAKK